MGYIEKQLMANENILHKAKLHWVRFISLRAIFTLLIAPILDGISTEVVVTNKRVIIKQGICSLKTLEMNLSQIETITIKQSLIGKWLDYGTISIAGSGGIAMFSPKISHPLVFRKKIQSN